MASRAALEILLQARDEASRIVAGAADSFGALGKSVGQVAQDLKPVGQLLSGVSAAGTVLIGSSTLVAARVQELGVVVQQLGENAGYSEGELASYEESISSLGITTQATRQAMAMMMQSNIDLAHSTDLARMAQDAAVIAQKDSSETFQDLIYIIQTGNTEMGRSLGLTLDFNAANERMAATLGKTTAELTQEERLQARLNEVMSQGVGIAGSYEAAMGTAGKQMRSLSRHWEEAQVALGETFLPALSTGVELATDALKAFNNLDPSVQHATASFLGLGTVVTGAAGGFILLAPRIVSTIEAFGTLAPMAQNVKAGLDLMKAGFSGAEVASTGLAGSTAALLSALGPLALAFGAIKVISHDYGVTLYDTQAGIEAATQSYDEYAAAMAVAGMEMEAMSQSQYALTSWTDGQRKALDDLTAGYYADIAAMGEAQGAMGPLGGAFGDVGSAATGAAGAVDGLNEAIASITVGDKVQELDLGAQAAYDMAASMGVADEALVELGVQLGLFSQAEADATRAIQVAAAEFAATGDVEAYRNAVADVTLALAADKQAAAEATGAIQYLTGGMVEGTNAAGPAASGLHNVAGGAQDAGGAFSRAAAEARHAAAAIRSIPTSWSVHVHTRYTESGVPPTATDTSGGASEYQHGTWYVPETGWAYLHQAEMVIPAAAAQGLRDMMGGGGGGGGIAMGGAGGGIVVQNYFGRDSVRSDADIEEIARQIEESLVLRGVRTFEV